MAETDGSEQVSDITRAHSTPLTTPPAPPAEDFGYEVIDEEEGDEEMDE